MERFRNKYRIPSARAGWWDYSANGCYFITICTANRECLLGDIIDDNLLLSPIGEIVSEEWERSFSLRTELYCEAYIIMPNHLHALLWIEQPELRTLDKNTNQNTGNIIRMPQSVSSFVAGFKSAVTRRVNKCGYASAEHNTIWQTRFHDHIVRNESAHQQILNYIHENPAKWVDDIFYL